MLRLRDGALLLLLLLVLLAAGWRGMGTVNEPVEQGSMALVSPIFAVAAGILSLCVVVMCLPHGGCMGGIQDEHWRCPAGLRCRHMRAVPYAVVVCFSWLPPSPIIWGSWPSHSPSLSLGCLALPGGCSIWIFCTSQGASAPYRQCSS